MALGKLKLSEGSGFDVPEGTHTAILYRIIEMGLHKSTYHTLKGEEEESTSERIFFAYELPDITDNSGRPAVISIEMSVASGPKSNLMKAAKALLGGNSAADEQLREGGLGYKDILGKVCQVVVTLNSKGRPKISEVVAAGSGILRNPPKLVNEPELLELDSMTDEDVDAIKPSWVGEKIKSRIILKSDKPSGTSRQSTDF